MVEHKTVREGTIAGLIGATTVAIWFFVVDAVAGQALLTPTVLGQALLDALPGPGRGEGALIHVLVYTVFHYGVFVIIGIIAAAIIHASDTEPSVLAGFLILFVAFELGIYIFIMLLERSLLGTIAWYQIGIANVLAAVFMGRYLVHAHPELLMRLDHALKDNSTGSR